MFENSLFSRRSLRCLFIPLTLLLSVTAHAGPPAWWVQTGPDGKAVINPALPAGNPKAVANIGQAKFMAKRAIEALRPIRPETADAIEASLVGPGKAISSWAAPAPGTLLAKTQFAPLLVGQLKAIADPFYTALRAMDSEWLYTEMTENGTADQNDPDYYFPWTQDPGDNQDKAIASIGQLKAVFSLRFENIPQTLTAADDGVPDEDVVTEIVGSTEPQYIPLPGAPNSAPAPQSNGSPNYIIQFKKSTISQKKFGYKPLYDNGTNKYSRYVTLRENIFAANINNYRIINPGWMAGYQEGGRTYYLWGPSHTRTTSVDRSTGKKTPYGYLDNSRWLNQVYTPSNDNPKGGQEQDIGTGRWWWWGLGTPPYWEYDVPPYNSDNPYRFDAPARMYYEQVLSDENSIDTVKLLAIRDIPPYTGGWKNGTPSATWRISKNNMGVTYSRFQFRILRKNSNSGPVRALVTFTPKRSNQIEIVKEVRWDGRGPSSQTVKVDPNLLKSKVEGNFHIAIGTISFELDSTQTDTRLAGNPVIIAMDETTKGGGNSFEIPDPVLEFPGMDDYWYNGSSIILTKLSGSGSLQFKAGTQVAPLNTNLASSYFKSGGAWTNSDWTVEGLQAGPVTMKLSYVKNGLTMSATRTARVVRGDLDIDADNNGTIDSTVAEENIENDFTKSGKIVIVDPDSQNDADGIPDSVDTLTSVKVEADGFLTTDKMKFSYAGSDPSDTESVVNAGVVTYRNAPGGLRIWKKTNSSPPTVYDQYVEPGRTYTLLELGITPGTPSFFYVQGVAPSLTQASIKCEISADDAVIEDSVMVTLVPMEIVPDYNRDGKIDLADHGKVGMYKPWRFWVNDDDDSGETGGNDIPQGYSAANTNGKNSNADGLRDLVDFFPLQLDIRDVLQLLPATLYNYRLTHSATNEDPSLRVIQASTLAPQNASDYLRSLDVAKTVDSAESRPIHNSGPLLDESFLASAAQQQGLLLVEGVKPTTSPIILKIQSKSSGNQVAEIRIQISISGIKDMFRYKYVTPQTSVIVGGMPGSPPNWPDVDRNNKNFVFVHGYNVNDIQSQGWAAEAFKRMFWSGSNARFSSFAWYGSQGQTFGITPDYQVNLDNAFGTAKAFKEFLDLLEGGKTVAAHSMGNILVGSAMHDWGARPANYLMLDAAAAKECYDPNEADDSIQDGLMQNQAWRNYPKILRASEWHRLLPHAAWPVSDWRGNLTWKGRLANVIQNGGQTNVYNFYSSGEEVLNNPTLDTPQTNNAITEAWLKPNRVWAVQEKRKGHGLTGWVHTSNYGGWRFNLMTAYDAVIHNQENGVTVIKEYTELPNPLGNSFLLHLATNPFFDRSGHPLLYDPQTGGGAAGSDYARDNRNTIISEMIPCMTLATGRNAFVNPATLAESHNIDMNTLMKTDPDKWPLSNANENNKPPTDREARPWLHSDIREKAFSHTWRAYQKFVEIGNLNETN